MKQILLFGKTYECQVNRYYLGDGDYAEERVAQLNDSIRLTLHPDSNTLHVTCSPGNITGAASAVIDADHGQLERVVMDLLRQVTDKANQEVQEATRRFEDAFALLKSMEEKLEEG